MAILKFRVYFEEDDSIYRDIAIKHTQSFLDFHFAILKSFEFDNKHQATFFRSNDNWQKGREISVEKYDKAYKVTPLIMADTTIGSEIKNPNEKFMYLYDFSRNWGFLIELINVSKDENPKISYPATVRTEGIAPSQYGTKSVLGDRFVDVEEKYDLTKVAEGFGTEGDDEGEESGEEEEGTEGTEGTGEEI
ncbi:MAG: hypothetical protein IT249_06230 [Chitinophagaceae bacterium]|nr:hypothetical protein [Chitinophagaceae bacterium]